MIEGPRTGTGPRDRAITRLRSRHRVSEHSASFCRAFHGLSALAQAPQPFGQAIHGLSTLVHPTTSAERKLLAWLFFFLEDGTRKKWLFRSSIMTAESLAPSACTTIEEVCLLSQTSTPPTACQSSARTDRGQLQTCVRAVGHVFLTLRAQPHALTQANLRMGRNRLAPLAWVR